MFAFAKNSSYSSTRWQHRSVYVLLFSISVSKWRNLYTLSYFWGSLFSSIIFIQNFKTFYSSHLKKHNVLFWAVRSHKFLIPPFLAKWEEVIYLKRNPFFMFISVNSLGSKSLQRNTIKIFYYASFFNFARQHVILTENLVHWKPCRFVSKIFSFWIPLSLFSWVSPSIFQDYR